MKLKKILTHLKEYGGYRKTVSGTSVRRDEPDQDLEMRQSDAIQSNSLARMKAQAKAKLKAGNKVPTRAGKKLFEDFTKDCGRDATKTSSTKSRETMKNIYNAAQHIDFDKWLIFVSEMV